MKVAQTAAASGKWLFEAEGRRQSRQRSLVHRLSAVVLLAFAFAMVALSQSATISENKAEASQTPPRVVQAQRFLAQRGWPRRRAEVQSIRAETTKVLPAISNASTAAWQPLGPTAVVSANYGLVTGRVSSIAIDPSDATGNRVFIGTTGGGIWLSQNAGTGVASSVVFTPLTDTLAALSGAHDASISVGAITVQPGGTGVILAGTGDPNDALDSYYGGGILRSTDGGNSWSVIPTTADQIFAFVGEGFSGFAWSTVDPQLVVAALSQAYEGTLVNAERTSVSTAGLYYSTDSGATWAMARITDGASGDVQGPLDMFTLPHGNAVTSVAWNPERQLFIAAVRFHGYYQSPDGVTWTRMATQPGSRLTTQMCPTNPGSIGSVACPMFRGTLAVNPLTGDTFAWSVDLNDQDQGLWQDQCLISGSACSNQTIAFQKQWNTAVLESDTAQGAVSVANGDYNLALTAVPSGQDTLLLAGANDLWKCSLAIGCVWRNTTNANSCMSAQVGGYQHALAWNAANPVEVFVGNDSGLWRSMDGIAETGSVCASTDASHFQNLNGGIGPLAEVVSMSEVTTSPYTMMTGLGVNGTAGVKSTTNPTLDWPVVLGGEGGPVAIDPTNASNWYVNNEAGVSIHLCSLADACTPSDFGTSAVVTDADVNGDGNTMVLPAPFIVDPLDPTQLLIGTCRVWRGPADGSNWSIGNAISTMLDQVAGNAYCSGDALIRTLAALPLAGGGEIIYVGMYGATDGGSILAGHVLSATLMPGSNAKPTWNDLTLNPVTNDQRQLNYYGLDISSIFIDPHDTSGKTVYVTVAGFADPLHAVRVAYRSTDGGAHWVFITSNLPSSPANSIVIDPMEVNTAYLATDNGVFATRQISTCGLAASNCWSAFGTALPHAPVVQLSAAPAGAPLSVLVAATYGRGVWQIPLWTAGTQLTTASVSSTDLTFATQPIGTASITQTVTLTNTGGIALAPTAIVVSGDFSETDNCTNASFSSGSSCAIQVMFAPTQKGDRAGQLTIDANVAGGQFTVTLNGTGAAAAVVNLSPGSVNFGQVAVGSTSDPFQVTAENSGGTAVALSSVSVTAPFVLASNACGNSLPANSDCQLTVEFVPTQAGAANGTLTVVLGSETQTVALSGNGASAAKDSLAPTGLSFPATATGQLSAPQSVVLTNDGDLTLTSIAVSVSAGFQTSNNCGTALAGHSNCSISVVFAPTQAGSQTGKLTVADALQSQLVALSGTGVPPAVIGVSPTQLSFPTQSVGAASAPLMLTISNAGAVTMANVGFQIIGFASGSFATSTTTCGATLSAGSSCTVQVIFTPATAGGQTAVLAVTSSTLGVMPVQVPLNGTGLGTAGINVSPLRMTFSVAILGQASAAQTATITNTSTTMATGLALTIANPFSLTQNTCGASLGAGASCSAGVIFTPSTNGTSTGSLTVSSTAFANSASLALSGTGGVAGMLQVQPALLNFAQTGVGTLSDTQTVTVTNTSAVTLTDLTGSVSGGFGLPSSTCSGPLAPGSSCSVVVNFASASAGQQTGSVTFASSALTASVAVPLSGMGADFGVALSGESSQTVSSGQTARYTMVLSPLSGSSGTFTFQCATLPAHASCAFNPASETVAANSTGSATIQIATGQSNSAAATSGPGKWRVLPVALGILLLPVAWGRRRKALLPLAVLLLAMGFTSCSGAGGGGGGSSPPGGGATTTPPGTYSVVVAASANGVSHKVTVSLTVD